MTPYYKDNHITQFNGHVLDVLPQLPAESVHMCVTSPPYWGLRDYDLPPQVWDDPGGCEHEWVATKAPGGNGSGTSFHRNKEHAARTRGGLQPGFCLRCGAWRGSLGLEPTPELYIKHIVQVFREVWRVLRPDATLWLNLGDSYAGGGRGGGGKNENDRWGVPSSKIPSNLKPKDLCGIPWRVALALQADGWWLRSAMPWVKRSAMPESVTDRPASALEYIFMLTKSQKYFFDIDAVRKPQDNQNYISENYGQLSEHNIFSSKEGNKSTKFGTKWSPKKREYNPAGRNFRNTDLFYQSIEPPHGLIFAGDEMVGLDVNPEATKAAHFATFASKLVEPCIKAGTSEKGCCPECGAAWVRVVESIKNYHAIRPDTGKPREKALIDVKSHKKNPLDGNKNKERYNIESKTIGWKPSCKCGIEKTIPCTVLDPFSGSGKTGIVAKKLGRRAILIELKDEYCKMPIPKLAQERLI